ncbi:MAG: tRNA pseudouridine synthase A [Firmicutes bacterium]|nr:tRNA pseudouridine synthase A [Bacillota bacterium]
MKPRAPKASSERRAAYRLVLEYDGGRFQGWQKQGARQSAQGVRTVAGTLERVLHQAGLHTLALMGSGRTDAGVHALGQVAHLHLEQSLHASELRRMLDEGLPGDIAVVSLESCSPAFHARHDAQSRTYLYQLTLRRTAFAKPYAWWVKGSLDLSLLEEAWRLFEGHHTIDAFADLEPGEDGRVHLHRCSMVADDDMVRLRVTGSFFLRRQVRRMVGAAVRCAQGKESLETLKLDLARPTTDANLYWSDKAAPAAGLFLESVQYGGEQGKAAGRGPRR